MERYELNGQFYDYYADPSIAELHIYQPGPDGKFSPKPDEKHFLLTFDFVRPESLAELAAKIPMLQSEVDLARSFDKKLQIRITDTGVELDSLWQCYYNFTNVENITVIDCYSRAAMDVDPALFTQERPLRRYLAPYSQFVLHRADPTRPVTCTAVFLADRSNTGPLRDGPFRYEAGQFRLAAI